MKRLRNIIIRTIEGRRSGAALFVRWHASGVCTEQGGLLIYLTTKHRGVRLRSLSRLELSMWSAPDGSPQGRLEVIARRVDFIITKRGQAADTGSEEEMSF